MVEVALESNPSEGASTVTTHYVVEHYEDEFSDWTFSEYVNMLVCLNKLYDTRPSHREVLVLTNFPFIA